MSHVPNLTVTVDGAVVVEGTDVVMIRRAKAPFQDRLVLPGGHAEESDLTLVETCARELAEEIGLVIDLARLTFLVMLNKTGADPRYPRRLSVVFRADISQEEYSRMGAGSDAASLELSPIVNLASEQVGFDHFDAILQLRNEKKGP